MRSAAPPSRRHLLALLVVTVSLGSSTARARPKLAVMEIQDQTRSLGAGLVESLTDSLRGMLARSGQFIVIDKSRQAAALSKLVSQQKRASYKACYDSRCQIPLGQALAADSILRTKLTRVGSLYLAIAELVDLEKEAVTAAAQAQVAAQPAHGRDDRLLHLVLAIGRQLCGDGTLGAAAAPPESPTSPPASAQGEVGVAPDERHEGVVGLAPPAESPEEVRLREERMRQAQLGQARRLEEARRGAAVSVGVTGSDEVRRVRAVRLLYGWMAIVGGGVVAAAGLYYLFGKAGQERDAADQASSPDELKTHADQAHSAQVTGGIVLGLGGAAVAAGLALVLTAPRVVQQPVNVAGMKLDRVPSAGPSGAQSFLVRWGGKF